MSKTFDKIEQDFSDAGDDYVIDTTESEDSILDDVSDDDSPTGELFHVARRTLTLFRLFLLKPPRYPMLMVMPRA